MVTSYGSPWWVTRLVAGDPGRKVLMRAVLLATSVAAVKFDFTTPASENGYCGYTEILVSGVSSPQPVRWAGGAAASINPEYRRLQAAIR